MTSRRNRRLARTPLVALGAGLVLVATACGAPGAEGDGPRVPAAASTAPQPEAPGPDCGDPTLSLKPPPSVPARSAFPADSTMRSILDKGHLNVGVDQSSFPFGYLDPVDNQLKGFDIDLLREVAKAIFGDAGPDRIRYQVLRNADRVPAVESGQVDIVAMTMTVNCERRRQVEFSDVYFEAGQRALVQKDPQLKPSVRQGLPGLAGYRVCAVAGSTSLQRIQDPQYRAIPVEGDTWADCLVKLQKGETDAISTDDTILAGLQAQDPLFTEVVGAPISSEPYGMAISKRRPDFVRFVNAVLAEVRRNGTWNALYTSHIGASLGNANPAPPEITKWRDAP